MAEIDEFDKIADNITSKSADGSNDGGVYYDTEKLEKLIAQALREVHERALSGAEDYLVKHYWDSLEHQRDLLNLHIKACFSRLKKSNS